MDSFIKQLAADFPEVVFRPAKRFIFSPPHTISYPKKTSTTLDGDRLLLLHELSHYLLKHQDYGSELDLLKMEAEAWEKAKDLAPNYQIAWNEDVKDDYLDSYRDLLHRRSICPTCQINGFFSNSDKS